MHPDSPGAMLGLVLRFTAMDCHPSAADYLLQSAGCAEARDARERQMEEAALRGDAVAYYLANQAHAGESPGKWAGRAAKMFGFKAGDAATIKQVRWLLGEMRNPVTGEQLGKPPKRYLSSAERMAERLKAEPNASAARRHELLREVSATQQTARGFYDATFSAPKSVSLLHASLRALGEAEQAEAVLEAHQAGIDAAMRYAGEHACWVRRGSHKSVAGQSVGKF